MSIEVLWMQAAAGDEALVAATSARQNRQVFEILATEGVVDHAEGGLLASAHADLWKVAVAAGRAIINGDDQADQGRYLVTVTTADTVQLNPPPGADKRIDIVYLQVADPQSGGDDGYEGVLSFVEGATHATAPVAPAIPDTAIVLAQVLRSSGDVALAGGMFADQRFPSAPFDGLLLDKLPVRLATAAALAASTVAGVDRVADANGALGNIDGVAAAVGDRILDKDHATTQHRGLWRITDIGSATRKWRMTRCVDADTSVKVRDGLWVRVREGSTLASTGWLLTTNDPITLGTTGLTFTQFPASGGASGVTRLYAASEGVGASGITSLTSVHSSGSITLGTGEIVITGFVMFEQASSSGQVTIELWDLTAGARVASSNLRGSFNLASGERGVCTIVGVHTPGAGARTYQLRISTSAGTVGKECTSLVIEEGTAA